jgi:integrase/recombinase XerC
VVLRVVGGDGGHRLEGPGPVVEVANGFLSQLQARGFAAATVRGYAYDLLNFARFCEERGLGLAEVVASDLFDWLDWQARPRRSPSTKVVRLDRARGAAPATMNRRVAAVRGLFEYAVIVGLRDNNPVPAPRRASGLRGRRPQDCWGMSSRDVPGPAAAGWYASPDGCLRASIRRTSPFLADLNTRRDRAIVLAMGQGGLRAGEVRRLRLADVDVALRRLRVVGKSGRERSVPGQPSVFRGGDRLPA